MADETTFRHCSSCRKAIPHQAVYWACSVSTCNRKRLGLFFCSVGCWDAHLPEAHHREAWAEEKRAPTREQALRDEVADEPAAPAPRRVVVASPAAIAPAGDLPRDILIVVSKLKGYVKAASSMNTSDGVIDVLSDHVRRLCDAAARVAAREGRRTIMDRDLHEVLSDWED